MAPLCEPHFCFLRPCRQQGAARSAVVRGYNVANVTGYTDCAHGVVVLADFPAGRTPLLAIARRRTFAGRSVFHRRPADALHLVGRDARRRV